LIGGPNELRKQHLNTFSVMARSLECFGLGERPSNITSLLVDAARHPTVGAALGAARPCERARPNGELSAAAADPKIKARFADLGGTSLAGSPADFAKLIADETDKWNGQHSGRSSKFNRPYGRATVLR
jgi:hypothetical protein